MIRRVLGVVLRYWRTTLAVTQLAVVLLTAGRYLAAPQMTYAQAWRHTNAYDLEYLVLHWAAFFVVVASNTVAVLLMAWEASRSQRLVGWVGGWLQWLVVLGQREDGGTS